MDTLPMEIILIVSNFLLPEDYHNFSQVNKFIHDILKDKYFFEKYEKNFQVKIGLLSVYRNDRVSKSIISCKGIIDFAVFIILKGHIDPDTSIEEINKSCSELNINYHIYYLNNFKDFSHMRNFALDCFKDYIKGRYIPKRTYSLFLDPELFITPLKSNKNKLTEICYYSYIDAKHVIYQKEMLLRSDINFRYIGKTHEVLNLDGIEGNLGLCNLFKVISFP